MAKLRLFANLREIAGTSRVEVPSETVGGVLEEAANRFGPDFRRGLETARVWINGEAAEPATRVGPHDEVVLIPPVSGGASPTPTLALRDLTGFLPLVVLVVAVLASLQTQEFWAAALVLGIGVWAMDLGMVFTARGRTFSPMAVVTSATGAALATHVLGGSGYGLSVAVAVVVSLGWAVALPEYRQVEIFSPTLLVSLVAGLATSSLLVARSAGSPDPGLADVFLLAAVVGVAAGSIIERIPPIPMLDPFSVTAVGAVLGAVIGAMVWDHDVVSYLLIGLAIAVALVAGRGFASMLRTGQVSLTEHPAGAAVSIDGIALAAAILLPVAHFVF